ncbi:MAG: YraN family protein [Bacteroidetes bacterium]|nr:YraN family protein [Bacteroidota bacterium]
MNELGQKGEQAAAEYLVAQGYKILERNWRFGKDEIDIIAEKGNYIVIVGLKARSTAYFGEPEDAVDKQKRRFLIRAADKYVIQKSIDLEVRFDIVAVIFEQGRQTIRHIEDAFYPTLRD